MTAPKEAATAEGTPIVFDSSTSNSVKEHARDEKEDGSSNRLPSSDGSDEKPTEEYPSGLRLFLIVGAVIMTVFLISLDQVSSSAQLAPSPPLSRIDHRRYSDPQNHGRIP